MTPRHGQVVGPVTERAAIEPHWSEHVAPCWQLKVHEPVHTTVQLELPAHWTVELAPTVRRHVELPVHM